MRPQQIYYYRRSKDLVAFFFIFTSFWNIWFVHTITTGHYFPLLCKNEHLTVSFCGDNDETSLWLRDEELRKDRDSARSNNDTSRSLRELSSDKVAQITFTNYGWHHPKSEVSMNTPRSLSSRALYNAILQHERYNATAWSSLNSFDIKGNVTGNVSGKGVGITPIIAFLDLETCAERNWPSMHTSRIKDSTAWSDLEGDRMPLDPAKDPNMRRIEYFVRKALSQPAMSHPDSRLVVFNCKGDGPSDSNGSVKFLSPTRDSIKYGKVIVISLSAHKDQINMHSDFGISPLPIKPVTLTEAEVEDIKTCAAVTNRKYKLSFMGRQRNNFPQFYDYFNPLHNSYKGPVYAKFTTLHYNKAETEGKAVTAATSLTEENNDEYYLLLRQSIFAAVPRGDNLYSYRFSEVLSAGAIPIIYSDGWVMPFTKSVVDWSEVGIVIPQTEVDQTMDIINNIPDDVVCDKQKKVLNIYKNYIKDSSARLRGILNSIDIGRQFDQNIASIS